MIIDRLHSELGILVHSVKHGSGSKNDGNTTRRFCANPSVVSEITYFNKELLERLAVILDTLSCGYMKSTPVNSENTAYKLLDYTNKSTRGTKCRVAFTIYLPMGLA